MFFALLILAIVVSLATVAYVTFRKKESPVDAAEEIGQDVETEAGKVQAVVEAEIDKVKTAL